MDVRRVALLRELLDGTGWVDGARRLATALRRSTRSPGGLLVVGTEESEPWHLTAHLEDEARWADLPELAPTLVRWRTESGAPQHLSVTLDRLARAGRGESVLVVAPEAAGVPLLERVDDARRAGATVVSLDAGDPALAGLVSERMVVAPSGLTVPEAVLRGLEEPAGEAPPAVSFDVAQHLVGAAVGEPQPQRRGWRDRLARALDAVAGPPGTR